MKKILVIVLFSLWTSLSLKSQIIPETRKEIKGMNNTYVLYQAKGRLYYVFNKKNLHPFEFPDYYKYRFPPFMVENKEVLDTLVCHFFVPFFKKHRGKFDEYSRLVIHLCSDMDGNLIEILVDYSMEAGEIPVEIVERFETALLSSSVSLKFDKTRRIFRNSSWARYSAVYILNNSKNIIKIISDETSDE